MPRSGTAQRQRLDVAGDVFVVERGLAGALAGLVRRRGHPAAIDRRQSLDTQLTYY